MSTFGSFNFQITSASTKPKEGTLTLTYTAGSPPTNASFAYTFAGNTQTIGLTFTGTAAPYSGVGNNQPLTPPWTIGGQDGGAFKYVTCQFTPPAAPALGSLTGQASKSPITNEDTISWEADPNVGEDAPPDKTATAYGKS